MIEFLNKNKSLTFPHYSGGAWFFPIPSEGWGAEELRNTSRSASENKDGRSRTKNGESNAGQLSRRWVADF